MSSTGQSKQGTGHWLAGGPAVWNSHWAGTAQTGLAQGGGNEPREGCQGREGSLACTSRGGGLSMEYEVPVVFSRWTGYALPGAPCCDPKHASSPIPRFMRLRWPDVRPNMHPGMSSEQSILYDLGRIDCAYHPSICQTRLVDSGCYLPPGQLDTHVPTTTEKM